MIKPGTQKTMFSKTSKIYTDNNAGMVLMHFYDVYNIMYIKDKPKRYIIVSLIHVNLCNLRTPRFLLICVYSRTFADYKQETANGRDSDESVGEVFRNGDDS
jgi:hypothetical protein